MSIGKANHGSRAVMREDVAIAVSSSTSAALGYAIFTPNNLDLSGAAILNTGTSIPDIYAGQQLTCANGTTSSGDLITYDPVDLTGSCSFVGNLTSASDVALANSANVGGNLIVRREHFQHVVRQGRRHLLCDLLEWIGDHR